MVAVKRERRPLRDMSLRASYVLYTLAAFAAITLICFLVQDLLSRERAYLQVKYDSMAVTYDVPDGGYYDVRYDGQMIYTIYDSAGRATDTFAVDEEEETPYVVWGSGRWEDLSLGEASDADSIVLVPRYSPGDQAWDWTLKALQTVTLPLCYGIGTLLCAFWFFRRRLKRPIELLTGASERIAANHLDFSIRYDRMDEMGRLCASFEKMRRQLLENNREMWRQMEERRQLNAAFSHDLRTPLTVLKGHSDLLLALLPQEGFSREEAAAEVRVMSANIARLEKYTEAMAKLQRLEDVEIRRREISGGELLRQIRTAAGFLLAEKELQWHLPEGEVQWLVDPEIVMEVCENLFSNAARYARRRVDITLSAAGDMLCLLVSDDGDGFSVRALEQALKPFYRAKDEGEEDHLGLGLSICRILCHRHGGEVSLANNARGGGMICAAFSMAADI